MGFFLRDGCRAGAIRTAVDACLGAISWTSAGRPEKVRFGATSPTAESVGTSAIPAADVPGTSAGRPARSGFEGSPPTEIPGETSVTLAMDVRWTSAGRPLDVRGAGVASLGGAGSGVSVLALTAGGSGCAGRTTGFAVGVRSSGGTPAGARPVGTGRTTAAGPGEPGALLLSLIE